jgi:cytochrome c peroxidase
MPQQRDRDGVPADEHGFALLDHRNQFKIPSLWGVHATAPYFHDNSANTLEEVVDHYADFAFAGVLSDQDKTDIVAYLKLL